MVKITKNHINQQAPNNKSRMRKFIPIAQEKIQWDTNIPQDVKDFCIKKINEARADRFATWQQGMEKLDIPNAKKQKLLISLSRNIKDNNRHIPEPLDMEVLEKTINTRPSGEKNLSFFQAYTNNLKEKIINLMLGNEPHGGEISDKVWIRIPSFRHDKENFFSNIFNLEALSHCNWCTKSRVDKAQAALEDGDFFVYVEKDKKKLWRSRVGMTSYQGKIDQIQGAENNNIIPIVYLDTILKFIHERNLQCASGIYDEGPKAYQQILIGKKLVSKTSGNKKTLKVAIRKNDTYSIFKHLGVSVKRADNDSFIIGTYKPILNINNKKGVTVPYHMFGINEDKLLENVTEIHGDMILYNAHFAFNSALTKFPEKIKRVTGKIFCTHSFYKRNASRINSVVNSPNQIVIANKKKHS